MALIKGEDRGPLAKLARAGLLLASLLFRAGSALRRLAYDRAWLPVRRAPLPTLSLGNITAGGTGKTPLAIHLAKRLLARGLRVAVLARGYGAARDLWCARGSRAAVEVRIAFWQRHTVSRQALVPLCRQATPKRLSASRH